MGIEPAVGGYKAVAVEVVVAGGVAAVVASVSEYLPPGDGACVTQSLVNEVPDISALEFRVPAHHVPILLEAPHGVAHGMGILTLYERARVVALGIPCAAGVIIVHRAEDVGLVVVAGLLILHGAAAVGCLHPVVSFLEVRPVASLVAQAPYDD